MTNFNFDNFIYARAPIPSGSEGGALNPAEPLYASIPLLIEINRLPVGDYAGQPYCYGLFFDNPFAILLQHRQRQPYRHARPVRLWRPVR